MSSPSNIQPSHAAMPDFHCRGVRSASRGVGSGAVDTRATLAANPRPASETREPTGVPV